MALTISCNGTDCVPIDDYREFVEHKVDLRDLDSIAASAPMLKALANDRSLIVNRLNERVANSMSQFASPSPGIMVLARGKNFYVRANIWPAMSDIANARAYQDQVAYNLAHDHNFSFLTVTHLGGGYETEIYEYDPEKVEGHLGETVGLRFLEKLRFSSGAVMLYRACRDVHIQYAPQELTITLNLMVCLPEHRIRDQYYFDVSKSVIAGHPPHLETTGRASLVGLAGLIGDSKTQELLRDLARRHPCRRTRLASFASLVQLAPDQAIEIWDQAAADPSRFVSSIADQRLKLLKQ